MSKRVLFFAFVLSFSFLFSCVKWWGPTDFGPLPRYRITSLAWSPDGKKLAFMGFHDEYTVDFNINLYLIDENGQNLKKIKNSPLKITPYRLFQWASADTLLTGNRWNLYQIDLQGQEKMVLNLDSNIYTINNACILKDSKNMIVSGQEYKHTISTLNDLFILKENEQPRIQTIHFQDNSEFKHEDIVLDGSLACSPFSKKIYLDYANKSAKKTFHSLAEIEIESNKLLSPLVFRNISFPTETNKTQGKLQFLGWKDEQTLVYHYLAGENEPELGTESHFYEYNSVNKTTTELKQISPEIARIIRYERAFAFSPDFTRIAYINETEEKLLLSDLAGKSVKTLFEIHPTLSGSNQP